MPLRDVFLSIVVFGSLPFCFVHPYIGMLVWSWLGFMNPHRFTWDFAYDLRFSQVVGVVTLAGLLFSRDRRPIPRAREVALLAGLWGLFVLSTLFAVHPELAWPQLERVSKILLMIFVTLMLFQDRVRLRYLLLVTALSLGYYGLKGGVWGLITGGTSGWVLGPPLSFIGDNNGLALGLTMTLPILFFLAREERRQWLRALLYTTCFFTIVAVLLTYSRSGFLGLVVVLLSLVRTMRWTALAVPAALGAAVWLGGVVPERWFERIHTILTYTEDPSAISRLNAWYVGWRLALDSPWVGGGFWAFSPETWKYYLPDYPGWHNAHSIYFHVLGEHGFTGAILFLTLIAATLHSLRKVRREASKVAGAEWLVNYSHMARASILGFLVTGVFQNLTYFDLFYLMVAVTIILKRLLRDVTAVAASQRGEIGVAVARDVGRRPVAVRSSLV